MNGPPRSRENILSWPYCFPSKIFSCINIKILLGRLQVVPKEIQNNAYVKCLRENKELCGIFLRTCLHGVEENGLVG